MARLTRSAASRSRKYYPNERFPDEIDASDVPNIYASVARGDCMEPVFHDQDCLVFSKSAELQMGDYVGIWFDPAIVPNGEPPRQIKRLAMGLMPGLRLPWNPKPGDEVEPLLYFEMFSPPNRLRIRASKVVAMHKVIGLAETNGDGTAKQLPLDTRLPHLPSIAAIKRGRTKFLVKDHYTEPLLYAGDWAAIDPDLRVPEDGGLFLIKWSGGKQEILQLCLREFKNSEGPFTAWMVAPFRRPRSHKAAEAWMEKTNVIDWCSDGPYPAKAMRELIVGKVVGIFRPDATA